MFTGFMTNNNVPIAGAQGWMNHCFFATKRWLDLDSSHVPVFKGEIERNPAQQCTSSIWTLID
jgi:hypothetical protein